MAALAALRCLRRLVPGGRCRSPRAGLPVLARLCGSSGFSLAPGRLAAPPQRAVSSAPRSPSSSAASPAPPPWSEGSEGHVYLSRSCVQVRGGRGGLQKSPKRVRASPAGAGPSRQEQRWGLPEPSPGRGSPQSPPAQPGWSWSPPRGAAGRASVTGGRDLPLSMCE